MPVLDVRTSHSFPTLPIINLFIGSGKGIPLGIRSQPQRKHNFGCDQSPRVAPAGANDSFSALILLPVEPRESLRSGAITANRPTGTHRKYVQKNVPVEDGER